ncbi:phosphotransferase family protein [Microthyrium microscopicum]|uniref:Phosphotransferase family protein n=1 Tax=Microthyrium microscopicum TaxID=703497 RepID=A0A6A6UPB4_9PEZI|nr:phosphotransferase family protein [Microthyrium microscopicum]
MFRHRPLHSLSTCIRKDILSEQGSQLRPFSHSTGAMKSHDWNYQDELFQFTRGRFLYNERKQFLQREVRFDMNKLAQIAVELLGAQRCEQIQKFPDGLFNKAYLFTMDDGQEIVGKVPNPNAGIAHYTTASEVATLDFVRNTLNIPAPRVLGWSSHSANNPVGVEYILMEKVAGVPLEPFWRVLKPVKKLEVFMKIFEYQKRLSGVVFPRIGSLYYASDLSTFDQAPPLVVKVNGEPLELSNFSIGPTVGQGWFSDGRETLGFQEGPWADVLEYRRAIASRELHCIRELHARKPMQMICGPKLYQPTSARKVKALELFQAWLPKLIPASQPELLEAYLWHNDLHAENILVNPEKPTEIMGIIDWQSTEIAPLFELRTAPSFLGYEGPAIDDKLEAPVLDKESVNSAEENARVIKQHNDSAIMTAWLRLLKKKDPKQYQAYRFQQTMPGTILHISQNIFEMGEAHLLSFLLQQQKQAGSGAPQLSISTEQARVIEEDAQLADKSFDLMSQIRDQMGDAWPDKGLVDHQQYQQAKEDLSLAKEDIATLLDLSNQEKMELERYWPFDQ